MACVFLFSVLLVNLSYVASIPLVLICLAFYIWALHFSLFARFCLAPSKYRMQWSRLCYSALASCQACLSGLPRPSQYVLLIPFFFFVYSSFVCSPPNKHEADTSLLRASALSFWIWGFASQSLVSVFCVWGFCFTFEILLKWFWDFVDVQGNMIFLGIFVWVVVLALELWSKLLVFIFFLLNAFCCSC